MKIGRSSIRSDLNHYDPVFQGGKITAAVSMTNTVPAWVRKAKAGRIGNGRKVAVVGGGLTGLETAELLIAKKSAETIHIIDMLPQIGMGMYPSIYVDVVKHYAEFPVTMLPGYMLKEVTDTSVSVISTTDNAPRGLIR